MLGDNASARAAADIEHVAPHLLDANPTQPRGPIEASSLDELTASIRRQGILQPLLVRRTGSPPARYQIVAGERRWRAAIAAGLAVVPCLVLDMTDEQSAAAALVENLQRVDLNAIEEAHGYERLVCQFDLSQDALADIVGKSRSHVANTMRLLKLPGPVQLQVRLGSISAGHARALLSHPDPVAMADMITARNLSVRQVESLASRAAEPRTTLDDKHADPDVEAIERDLADHLGLSVTLRTRGGRGALTIRFTRLEQLDVLLERLGSKPAGL